MEDGWVPPSAGRAGGIGRRRLAGGPGASAPSGGLEPVAVAVGVAVGVGESPPH
jgi:hypothetical protein